MDTCFHQRPGGVNCLFCSSLKSHILSLTSYLTSQTSWWWRLFRQFTQTTEFQRCCFASKLTLYVLKVTLIIPTQVTFVINDLDVHIYWKSPGKAYWGIDDKKVKSRWRLINYLWTVQQQKQTCYTRIWPEFSKWDCCFFIVGCITYFFSNPVIIVHEVEKWHNPLRKYSVTWTFFHVNSLSCFRMKSVFIFQA